MKTLKLALVAAFAPGLALAVTSATKARPTPRQNGAPQKSAEQVRRERFRHNGVIEQEGSPDPNAGLSSGGIEGAPVVNPVPTTATKAPARGPVTASVTAGEKLFKQIGCAVCHADSITTAMQGSVINGGTFIVPAPLGNKVIHPFSDFLLHNIGTGDGIPILNTPEYAGTANQIRTAPLWGLRTRNRLMHDGLSFTLTEAIARHAGQAASVTKKYASLNASQKAQVLAFLNAL